MILHFQLAVASGAVVTASVAIAALDGQYDAEALRGFYLVGDADVPSDLLHNNTHSLHCLMLLVTELNYVIAQNSLVPDLQDAASNIGVSYSLATN